MHIVYIHCRPKSSVLKRISKVDLKQVLSVYFVYNILMKTFSVILKELMTEHSVDAKTLADVLGLSDSSIIYKWIKDEKGLLLPTAVKIADYFHCLLDYLFGRSEDYGKDNYNDCPPFDLQFRKVLDEQKVSQYKLLQDKVISGGNIDSWLNRKQTPHIESIIKLANYLNVTMDYLVGRED